MRVVQTASEAVIEFSCPLGHALEKPFVPREKDDNFVLLSDVICSENESLGLFKRHWSWLEMTEEHGSKP